MSRPSTPVMVSSRYQSQDIEIDNASNFQREEVRDTEVDDLSVWQGRTMELEHHIKILRDAIEEERRQHRISQTQLQQQALRSRRFHDYGLNLIHRNNSLNTIIQNERRNLAISRQEVEDVKRLCYDEHQKWLALYQDLYNLYISAHSEIEKLR